MHYMNIIHRFITMKIDKYTTLIIYELKFMCIMCLYFLLYDKNNQFMIFYKN